VEGAPEPDAEIEPKQETGWKRFTRFVRSLAALACLRLRFGHLALSVLVKYDPFLPRSYRLYLAASLVVTSLFFSAFFYAFRHGQPGSDLPVVAIEDIIVIALIVAAISVPTSIALHSLVRWAGRVYFRWRHPGMYDELQRRKAAEELLARFDTHTLLQAADRAQGVADAPRGSALALASALTGRSSIVSPQGLSPRGDKDVSTSPSAAKHRTRFSFLGSPGGKSRVASIGGHESTEPTGPAPTPLATAVPTGLPLRSPVGDVPVGEVVNTPVNASFAHAEALHVPQSARAASPVLHSATGTTQAAVNGDASRPPSPVAAGAAVAPAPASPQLTIEVSEATETAAAVELDRELPMAYQWVDAPPGCIRFCGWPLRCAGRHPSQKAAYIKRQRQRLAKSTAKLLNPSPATGGLLACLRRAKRRGPQPLPGEDPALFALRRELALLQDKRQFLSAETRYFLSTGLAFAVLMAWSGFCLFYIVTFGATQPAYATGALAVSWLISQGIHLLVTEPGKLLLRLFWALIFQVSTCNCILCGRNLISHSLQPLIIPLLIWIPTFGPLIAGKVTMAVMSDWGDAVLSTRLTHLTIYAAAGTASYVAAESAIVAFVPETLAAVGTLNNTKLQPGSSAERVERTARLRAAAITALYNTVRSRAAGSPSKPKALPKAIKA
jgi:hypothetical protein